MDIVSSHSWLSDLFLPEEKRELGYLSKDQRLLLEIKEYPISVRDVHTRIIQLALRLQETPALRQGCLAILSSRLTLERIEQEWGRLAAVLCPVLVQRMVLIVVNPTATALQPETPFWKRVAEALRLAWFSVGTVPSRDTTERRRTPTSRHYEVFKILLTRWLQKALPLGVGKLARQVGCSQPTVRQALARLERQGLLTRQTTGAVGLSAFPEATWLEYLALVGNFRAPLSYRDSSGHPFQADNLLRRLQRQRPPRVAVGGVTAARHWDPHFDLNGTPRVNLLLHTPDGSPDLSFLRKLDPALQPAAEMPADVVIHLLHRHDPLFEPAGEAALPWADPVETALDLHEMRLPAQANALFAHLRPEVRPS